MAKKSRRKKKQKSTKADVGTYRHDEAKRKNIPTAENQKLVADEDIAIQKLRWPRNPDLDPQLVWRDKDFEPDPLEVDAPPIYIQEKIQPRAIVEDLRRQTRNRRKQVAPQFDFFHDFNGLPEGWKEDATASYYHDEGNWQNRMILGDSLLVMASLAEREDCAEGCSASISIRPTALNLTRTGSRQRRAEMFAMAMKKVCHASQRLSAPFEIHGRMEYIRIYPTFVIV
jgi:hypothetical protein